jgi:hypothetical protein
MLVVKLSRRARRRRGYVVIAMAVMRICLLRIGRQRPLEAVGSTATRDVTWSTWTRSETAERCYVSDDLVNRIKTGLTSKNESEAVAVPERTFTTKTGSTAVWRRPLADARPWFRGR